MARSGSREKGALVRMNTTVMNIRDTDQTVDVLGENDDLLEPQYYPDATFFRASLEGLIGDEEIFKKTLLTNKATFRALAPYLKIIHKDQKRKIESARQKPKYEGIPLEKKSKEQVMNVVVDLTQDPELISSVVETGNQLKNLIKAKKVCIYLVNCTNNELNWLDNQSLRIKREATFKIEEGATMASYVAYKKDYVLSNNVLSDPKFPQGLGIPDPLAKFGLGVPIKTSDDVVVAVYEFTREGISINFDKREIQMVLAVTAWIGSAVLQKYIFVNNQRQHEVGQCLQQLSFNYHCSHVNVNSAFSDIVVFARETIKAEHCSFYLVIQKYKNYLIVEKYEQESEESKNILKRCRNIVVTDDDSYLCKVLMRKETINKIDESNSTIRSILSAPILCSCNEALGAIQLINKYHGETFSKDDEQTLLTCSSYVSIHFFYNKGNDSALKAEIQGSVIRNMLHYHITPCIHDQDTLKRRQVVPLPDNFFTFAWYPSLDDMPRLAELTISMFQEVLGDSFMLLNNVPKFVLTVQNCYRPNPYHNFLHAFVVTNTMANIISRYHYLFNGLERNGLMVAALCHDVDHRGYTNNFIQLTKHYLSSLYSSSPLENHHCAITKMIIERCSMFSYLKPGMYDTLLRGIHKYIIATDLSLYFQCRMELMRVADEKTFTFKNPNHRNLVLSLIMTTCDLSGQTKPMAISRKITEDVYEEFFQQGDVEKKMGCVPIPTMDRDKKDMLFENQVQFLSIAVIPCIETVSRIFGMLSPMVEDTKALLKQWKELVEEKEHNSPET